MNYDAEIKAMSLFIEKADKLRNSTFVKRITNDSGVNLSTTVGKPTIITRKGPDDENIDAFVLTFRFFIQDNEPISLRKIKNAFYSDLAKEDEKCNYDRARKELNQYLDGYTMFNINGMVTRRELMNVFIYGGLSHANTKKKEMYDGWMGNVMLAPFMQNEFSVIINEVLNFIVFIRNLCESLLKRVNSI